MSNNVDIFINGKTNFPDAAEKSKRGLHELSEALERSKDKLRSFNTLFELGLGFQVGRRLFDQLHEGAKALGEGFAEARKEGEAFWASFGEGVKHTLGIKTVAEQLKELKAALKSNQAGNYSVEQKGEALFDKLGIGTVNYGVHSERQPSAFEKLGKDSAAAADAYFDAAEKQKRQILLGQNEKGETVGETYDAASARLGQHQQYLANYRAGKGTVEMAVGLLANGIAPTPEGLEEQIKRDQKAVAAFQAQINEIDELSKDARAKLKNLVDVKETWKKIGGFFLGGAEGSDYTTLGSVHAFGVQMFGAVNDARARASLFGQPLIPKGPLGNRNLPQEINNQIMDLMLDSKSSPQQKSIAAHKLIGSFGSMFGLDRERNTALPPAENQRFLTMGKGTTKTPEVTELEKNRMELEEIGKKLLPDLIQAVKGFLQKVGAA